MRSSLIIMRMKISFRNTNIPIYPSIMCGNREEEKEINYYGVNLKKTLPCILRYGQ